MNSALSCPACLSVLGVVFRADRYRERRYRANNAMAVPDAFCPARSGRVPGPKRLFFVLVLWLCGLLAAAPLRAQTLPDADAEAVRAVVEGQLAAFAADDAERAFSFAAPSIRSQFGNAPNFMAMVLGQYAMLVRPASVLFLLPQPNPRGNVLQQVLLRDAAGRLWRATYRLERDEATAGWRINGCVVAPDDGARST